MKLNKYEREVSEKIHVLEREILRNFNSLGISRGVRIDSQLYYDSRGFPSRCLEIYTGPRSSIRVDLQRNVGDRTNKWTLSTATFEKGLTTGETEHSGNIRSAFQALSSILFGENTP